MEMRFIRYLILKVKVDCSSVKYLKDWADLYEEHDFSISNDGKRLVMMRQLRGNVNEIKKQKEELRVIFEDRINRFIKAIKDLDGEEIKIIGEIEEELI